jgi:transcriptional regulator with XRE-family HTH domain
MAGMSIAYHKPSSPVGRLTLQVAEEIRAMMGRKRVNQAGLARQLGVSQPWVSDRLRGNTPIDLTDLERIAVVLGVKPLDLMPTQPPVSEPAIPTHEHVNPPIRLRPANYPAEYTGPPDRSRRPSG